MHLLFGFKKTSLYTQLQYTDHFKEIPERMKVIALIITLHSEGRKYVGYFSFLYLFVSAI